MLGRDQRSIRARALGVSMERMQKKKYIYIYTVLHALVPFGEHPNSCYGVLSFVSCPFPPRGADGRSHHCGVDPDGSTTSSYSHRRTTKSVRIVPPAPMFGR